MIILTSNGFTKLIKKSNPSRESLGDFQEVNCNELMMCLHFHGRTRLGSLSLSVSLDNNSVFYLMATLAHD